MAKDGAASLIVAIPAALRPSWVAHLPAYAARFRPAALILPPPFEGVEELIVAARPFEVATLIRDDIAVAARAGADGVYLAQGETGVAGARSGLGSAAIVGAACGLSRHAAMESAERGADFIAFELTEAADIPAAAALCAWWEDITEIPAAIGCGSLRAGLEPVFEARPSFFLVTEEDFAGESLTFAAELGLQSVSPV